jgi:hypothetical protein
MVWGDVYRRRVYHVPTMVIVVKENSKQRNELLWISPNDEEKK